MKVETIINNLEKENNRLICICKDVRINEIINVLTPIKTKEITFEEFFQITKMGDCCKSCKVKIKKII